MHKNLYQKIAIAIFILPMFLFGTGFPSEYYKIKDVKEQKEYFSNLLVPMIEKTNSAILNERDFIDRFFKAYTLRFFRKVPKNELSYLNLLKEKYRIELLFDKNAYLRKIDAIPISLTLAQASIESGWGKSRFTRVANNIFGQWTWGKEGIVPEGRDEGKRHKIKIFKSLQHSVDEYALNLNRHYAYKEFRKARKEAKDKGVHFDGLKAAKTMLYYSELREKYVKMLEKVIEDSGFNVYDYKPAAFMASD